MDNSHLLTEGIALEGVIWAGEALTNASGDVPVILAGNTPLLSVREDALSRRHITLNFNPLLSTLTSTPDWPILFWNLLQWRATETPGLKESNTRLGSEVTLRTAGEPVNRHVAGWNSKYVSKNSRPTLPSKRHCREFIPWQWAGRPIAFAVNPLAADESDLSACVTGQWGAWGTNSERRMEEASLVWDFGLAALSLADLAPLSARRRERRTLNMFTLFQPVWLLLLIPLAAAWFIWPLPNRGLRLLRAVVFVTIVLAVAQLALRLPEFAPAR
ncbi:MAG: hypothetical protein WDM80_17650 [Limisphaerales bacterium]